ncbi:MAG: hypothetical protein EA399_08735 [Desulfovibrionales bacterium]|nr:MAG: hypothetical protein EA399_08735 [Desulfovibrionales bacterium]
MFKSLRSIFGELQFFRGNQYPGFVTACCPEQLLASSITVFMFHTVEPQTFEAQLKYLQRNHYQVLDADQLYMFLQERVPLRSPGVMLTFDDGERSLYQTAYPLLKKYSMKAVAFLVPGRIRDDRGSQDQGLKQWLTWQEVREMQASGYVDMQSHTMDHERIFTGPQLLDFLQPGQYDDDLRLDMPTVLDDYGKPLQSWEPGTPIYTFDSRMGDAPRYLDSVGRRRACIEHVRNQGGSRFFQQSGWKCELHTVWKKAQSAENIEKYESVFDQRNAIYTSLKASRDVLEERLQKPVRHVAFPWCRVGKLARVLSQAAGYTTNFLGPIPGKPLVRPGCDPFSIPRIKDDYLFRLPGKGRHSLFRVFGRKLIRRMYKKDIY